MAVAEITEQEFRPLFEELVKGAAEKLIREQESTFDEAVEMVEGVMAEFDEMIRCVRLEAFDAGAELILANYGLDQLGVARKYDNPYVKEGDNEGAEDL